MAFQLPVTIATVIRRIQTEELVLPAIQREFVWDDMQVARLFDSVMRGYPIGSFLSWKVEPMVAKEFKFYEFLRDYHAKDRPHCEPADPPAGQTVIAVLDGQQRLTSLNIGLRGSYASRLRGGWWNNPKAFPKRRLYLNVLRPAPDNELGMKYDFQFLAEPVPEPSDELYWFPVHKVFEMVGINDLMVELATRGIGNDPAAARSLSTLYESVHALPALYFYEETDQDVEKVLDIFIRVNSGGTTLSYSDLLLSIATAQWEKLDARAEIHGLVDGLNGTGQGFRFSKDAILKTGLVLIGSGDIGFKVKNFNRANMLSLEKQWEEITEALEIAVGLLSDFGLSETTLTATSVLVPLAYYVHHRDLKHRYRTNPATSADRKKVRDWVIRTLIKPGVWGSGLDTLLRELRDTITENGDAGFPVDKIEARMASLGKSLTFSEQEIDDMLASKYGGKRTFAVLALLFPHVDTRNVHHVDHIYPRGLLATTKLKAAGLTEGQISQCQGFRDLLPNLQLLEGPENINKKDKQPAKWARMNFPGDLYTHYLDKNDLPALPSGPEEFVVWYEARRDRLRARLLLTLDLVPVPSSPSVL